MKIAKSVKLVAKLLKNDKKELLLLAVLSLLTSLLSATVPYIYGKLVDTATRPGSIKPLFAYLGAWLIITIVINNLERIVDYRQVLLAVRAGQKMLTDISSYLVFLPIQFHKDKKVGSVLNKIDRAADYLQEIISQVVFGTLPNIVSILFVFVFLSVTAWKIGILIFILLTLFTLVTLRKSREIVKMQRRLNQVYEYAFGEMYDTVLNVDTVKANVSERLSTAQYKTHFQKGFNIFVKQQNIWKFFQTWQNRVSSFGFIIIFGAALFMLRGGSLSIGEFVMVIGYMSMIYRPFWNLTHNIRTLQRGTTAIERAAKLLDQSTEAYDDPKTERLKETKGHFVFKNVCFAYKKDKEPVLTDISFEANPGEVVALVGESGVGKSTLVSLLSRYYTPISGEIFLDGIRLNNISLKDLRKNIAVVPQEVMLFNDTIRNNIKYGKVGVADEEIFQAAQAANAHEFIEKFSKKYDQIVGERGIKLSTGQKQRVAIARALLRDPKILILDEATSALDSQSEKLVQEALARLIKGKTTFIIAHRLSTIRHADKIIVMDKGRIVQTGTHEELIRQDGLYKHLCSLQHMYL